MSNHLAIAAVTSTLRSLLEAGITGKDADVLDADLSDTKVTAQPPDKARAADAVNNQINLFLYHVVASAAWRNTDMPRRAPAGERGIPPLGLNLYYLVSVYGRGPMNTEIFAHRLLGRTMNILQDHPLLDAGDVQTALVNNDLYGQLERLRITLQPLSLDELSKLWTGFQTQFRLSAAYEVAAVLIDSNRPAPSPLPVLARATGTQPDTMPPFPFIDAVLPPGQQPSARLADTVTISGRRLDGEVASARFRHIRQTVPQVLAPTARTATTVTVAIPNDPARWPSGFYTVSLVITRSGREMVTNEMAMSLVPRILTIRPNPAVRDPKGNVTLAVDCSPEVLPEQPAALIVGDRTLMAQPLTAPAGTLTFFLSGAAAATSFVRLRVDGAESLLVDRSTDPPIFDQSQRIQIT